MSKEICCPICGSDSFLPYRMGLVRCNSCNVVLSHAIWQPQSNEKLEEEWFGKDYKVEKPFWVSLFEAYNNRKTLARLGRCASGRRLLEVGVGSGSFLKAAKQQGYSVMGCDISASICESVCRIHGVPMHADVLATLSGEGLFDVIVMNHVLEHVQQPIEFMHDVSRLLTPGGVVHIAVPNIACLEARFSGWNCYEPYHLIYFDPQTLRRTISTGGLIVSRVCTNESFSGWFLVILRTALGVRRVDGAGTFRAATRRSGIIEHAYRLSSVCIGGGLWPLRVLQAKFKAGDEVICIAQKASCGLAQ
ncbi:MAG: class I SAM-dependent methyltransferase [Nitrospirota bacterium]